MEKDTIPFPKIKLDPFNMNDLCTLHAIGNQVCEPQIKELLIDHMQKCFTAHRYNYPTEPKEFYIIPFAGMQKNFEEYKLRTPEFAALWLPSVALNTHEIIHNSEEKELAIIAWDNHFSRFSPKHVLVADLSMGFPTFVLWQNDYKFNPECHILAESIE